MASPLNAKKFATQKAEEDREQQQRVFCWLSKRVGFFDQETGALHRCFGFGRSKPFHVQKRIDERDLKLDLLATQRQCGGQRRDLSRARA